MNKLEGRDATRELVRIRSNYLCQNCGEKQGKRRLDIHHLKGCGVLTQKYDRQANTANLVALCHFCHMNLPHIYQKEKRIVTEEKRQETETLREKGVSLRKISEAVDLSYPVVWAIVAGKR